MRHLVDVKALAAQMDAKQRLLGIKEEGADLLSE